MISLLVKSEKDKIRKGCPRLDSRSHVILQDVDQNSNTKFSEAFTM
jgi:hypothetical protein